MTAISGVGAYVEKARICLLDFDYVLRDTTTPTNLAGTIVHELTHARLVNCGFAYTTSNRARIERLCFGAELLLARRAPDGAGLAEEAQRFIQKPNEFWSAEANRARDMDKLKELGRGAQMAYRITTVVSRLFRRRAI